MEAATVGACTAGFGAAGFGAGTTGFAGALGCVINDGVGLDIFCSLWVELSLLRTELACD